MGEDVGVGRVVDLQGIDRELGSELQGRTEEGEDVGLKGTNEALSEAMIDE